MGVGPLRFPVLALAVAASLIALHLSRLRVDLLAAASLIKWARLGASVDRFRSARCGPCLKMASPTLSPEIIGGGGGGGFQLNRVLLGVYLCQYHSEALLCLYNNPLILLLILPWWKIIVLLLSAHLLLFLKYSIAD